MTVARTDTRSAAAAGLVAAIASLIFAVSGVVAYFPLVEQAVFIDGRKSELVAFGVPTLLVLIGLSLAGLARRMVGPGGRRRLVTVTLWVAFTALGLLILLTVLLLLTVGGMG
jgi:hypothetical protein